MKLLLIDAGNSQLKWRCEESLTGELLSRGVIGYVATAEDIITEINQKVGKPEQVGISCVKSASFKACLVDAAVSVWRIEPFVATVNAVDCGLRCSYQDPSRLGIDRWLAMIAVRHRCNGSFCVVDSGSATTFDWVSSQGDHLGGYIVAGLRLSVSALLAGTDQVLVESDKLSAALPVPGKGTTDAVYNGALFAFLAQVKEAYQYLLSVKDGAEACMVLAGGDAALLSSHLKVPHEVVNDLVFEGLKVMLENKGVR